MMVFSKTNLAFLLLGASTCLVIVSANYKSVGYDEAITLLELSGNASPAWPDEITPAGLLKTRFDSVNSPQDLLSDLRDSDVHPPLYYLTAWAVHALAGLNVLVQRLVSGLAVLTALIVMCAHWRRRGHETEWHHLAAFGAIFLTLPGLHFAATTARGYGMAIAFLSLAYVATDALMTRPARPRRQELAAGAVGVCCGAAIATNYLATFIAGTLWVGAFVLLVRQRQFWATAALIGAAAPFAGIAASFLAVQIDARPDQAAGFLGVLEMVGLLIRGLLMSVPDAVVPHALLAFGIGALGSLAFAGAIWAIRAGDSRALVPLMLVAIHVAGLVTLSWASDKTLAQPRYLSLAGPFLALVLAHGALWLASRKPASWTLATLPWVLAAGQAALVTSVLAFGGEDGAIYARTSERAATTPVVSTVLLTDTGFGRGLPGAVVLSAAPETPLWITPVRDLRLADMEALPGRIRHVHIVMSLGHPSSVPAFLSIHPALQDEGWVAEEVGLPYVRYRRPGSPGRHRRRATQPGARARGRRNVRRCAALAGCRWLWRESTQRREAPCKALSGDGRGRRRTQALSSSPCPPGRRP